MRILHFSDVHFWRYGLDFDPTFKRALGVANLLARRARQFPRKYSEAILQRILATEADAVCFTGDISTSSLRSEFRAGRKFLAPIAEKWGPHVFSVPGNHDRYTRRASRGLLFEKHFAGEELDYPFLVSLDGVDFIGIDTTRPCFVTSRGTFPTTRLEALNELLDQREQPEHPYVLLSHYPYCLPGGKIHSWGHRLNEAPDLVRLLSARPPALFLHGHIHKRWAHLPPQTPDTLCVNAGSAGMRSRSPRKNAGFLLIDFDPKTGKTREITVVALEPRSLENFVHYRIWPEETAPEPPAG